MKRVFISYCHEDWQKALNIYDLLKSNPSIEPWLDKKCLLPGQDWRTEIEKTIKHADYFLALLSSNSITKKGFVQNELRIALEVLNEFPEGDIFVIPIRLDNCVIPSNRLLRLHYIDLFPSMSKGWEQVLGAIGVGASLWEDILGDAKQLSILVGATHHSEICKEVVFDWDVRTAANLVSFLAAHGYSPRFEPPIYTPEILYSETKEKYLTKIRQLIFNKNAIVIGSADSNPLTEVLLGYFYGIHDDMLFHKEIDMKSSTNAVIAFRKKSDVVCGDRYFFRELEKTETPEIRGFLVSWLNNQIFGSRFVSQVEMEMKFETYAHLVIGKNPYSDTDRNNYIILLNGVTGPAIFALSELLMSQSMEQYQSDLTMEKIRNRMKDVLKKYSQFCGVELLVKVDIGSIEENTFYNKISDWRKVFSWEILPHTMRLINRF